MGVWWEDKGVLPAEQVSEWHQEPNPSLEAESSSCYPLEARCEGLCQRACQLSGEAAAPRAV